MKFNKKVAVFLALVSFLVGHPSFAAFLHNVQLFGGYGQDGTKTVSGTVTESFARSWNFLSYTVNASSTHNVPSGSIINSLQPATVSGTVSVGAGYPGGRASSLQRTADSGRGPGGGSGRPTIDGGGTYGGAGGACIGAGGDGGASDSSFAHGSVGLGFQPGLVGSGGGAGMSNSSSNGAGGAGGGRFILCSASTITLNSSSIITAKGSNGQSTTAAGGGGSGGVVALLSSVSLSLASGSTIDVSGGNGGSGTSGGGSGGGGLVYLMAPSISNSATINLAQGTAGSGGSSTSPSAGTAGSTISITGTPSLPLMVWMLDHPNQMRTVAGGKYLCMSAEALSGVIARWKYAEGDRNFCFYDLWEKKRVA